MHPPTGRCFPPASVNDRLTRDILQMKSFKSAETICGYTSLWLCPFPASP